jgi:hypothetical protein
MLDFNSIKFVDFIESKKLFTLRGSSFYGDFLTTIRHIVFSPKA